MAPEAFSGLYISGFGDASYGEEVHIDALYEAIASQNKRMNEAERAFIDGFAQGILRKTLGPPGRADANNLSEVRWGIIWPPEPLSLLERQHQATLQDLINLRHVQMGDRTPHQFVYRSGWTADDFLFEEGRRIETGSMQTAVVPYYLCIVGSPERIPWEFQQQLDAEYAVGRIWFDDPADCHSYIKWLLTYERGEGSTTCAYEALFLGTQHKNDRFTQLSSEMLVKPLHAHVRDAGLGVDATLLLGDQPGEEAYKRNLLTRLRGYALDGELHRLPALLFLALHGYEDTRRSTEQRARQGAPIFQEWPSTLAEVRSEEMLTGMEVNDTLHLMGTVGFCCACYSAGTPTEQDWVQRTLLQRPERIADAPFVSYLPQKLLAQGMIAVVGHVSRVWEYSFVGSIGVSEQEETLKDAVHMVLQGQRIGHATNAINTRWIHLTRRLEAQLDDRHKYSKEQIRDTWGARNDCRGYVILGDPAARLDMTRLVS